jgi:hypothetical protein
VSLQTRMSSSATDFNLFAPCAAQNRAHMSSSAMNSNLFHAVRGVKLCEAFELFCRWRQQNALLAIFH